MFVGENVKGLLTMGGGTIIEAIVEDFHNVDIMSFINYSMQRIMRFQKTGSE